MLISVCSQIKIGHNLWIFLLRIGYIFMIYSVLSNVLLYSEHC